MIDNEVYNSVLEKGLSLDHYNILIGIRDGNDIPKNKRIDGFLNLLHKKGYLEDGNLTDLALELIGTFITTSTTQTTTEKENPLSNFDTWVHQLHEKCEETLKELTGKKQVRADVLGTKYSFLPNPQDLKRVVSRVIGAYKLKDYRLIEKTILTYIDRCAKSGKWTPILIYYIMKNGLSSMVTDMRNGEQENSSFDDTITNI